ncbi:sigma-70 family RNA polymerase sigma factor [Roseimaritima sediminicola]|uniref:sigma-70 family RNA polymerase sigma factor n=1 Tax=Roseimaritima sediminicola TaxID=2662066 RepID=UPI0012984630|nr:sigma-70 family RNA polymerase sigma factor [Roseimaritima sediminicola]
MTDPLRDPDHLYQYEPYLRMLARLKHRRAYQAKVGVSDIVQQSLMQAVQAIDDFRGSSEAELRAWLRQILVRNIAHLDRDMHRDKRDVRREQSIEQQIHQSSMRLEGWLAGSGPTPSHDAAVGEHVLRLARAIESLPEGQREAVRLHYLEGLKLSEVADRLDKSTSAVAGLLHRGMKALRRELATLGGTQLR